MDRSYKRENFILQGTERLVGKGRTLREGSLKKNLFSSKQKLQTGCKRDVMEIIQLAMSPPTGREGVRVCACQNSQEITRKLRRWRDKSGP